MLHNLCVENSSFELVNTLLREKNDKNYLPSHETININITLYIIYKQYTNKTFDLFIIRLIIY